ncbi:hypothetical protein QRX50_27665 [Amycolatopsis carbonis]|uniref:Uncharacterized protein n=1 Tax=Amycolatopsis carbonis TaxID=715471 RepID=A0A9Y2N2P9_9PSEU|nr:hypothetical protein [Amycolatopsis sp. 2-15]WIX84252.1 hypothetical protein QRX50_27665 [Amycolatopsis sp. 2-15]
MRSRVVTTPQRRPSRHAKCAAASVMSTTGTSSSSRAPSRLHAMVPAGPSADAPTAVFEPRGSRSLVLGAGAAARGRPWPQPTREIA